MTMTWAGLNPGDYISGAEMEKPVTMTITGIERVDFEKEDGDGHEKRGVMSFSETERRFVLNKTNIALLAAMWSTPDASIGHKVTIGPEQVQFGAETVTGIRVLGSPELEAPLTVMVKLPRRKPLKRTLTPTLGAGRSAAADPSADASPLRVMCAACDVSVPLTEDATADDVASMTCDTCGGVLEVVS
jgi:hypothetical protein